MRCTERRLTPATVASLRPVQWVVSPGGCPSARSTTRCRRKRRLAGPPGLVTQEALDALRREAGLPAPDDGLRFARPAHHLKGAAALRRGEDDVGPPDMLLGRIAIRDDRPQPTAILRRDGDDDPCSHPKSLNRFGRFGNRPNESDH